MTQQPLSCRWTHLHFRVAGKVVRVHYFRVHELYIPMKNITLSADDSLIEAAREQARAEHTTLNDQFRLWLAAYVQRHQRVAVAMSTIAELQGALISPDKTTNTQRKFTRAEMNER